jgi:hypothetical protein
MITSVDFEAALKPIQDYKKQLTSGLKSRSCKSIKAIGILIDLDLKPWMRNYIIDF